MLVVGILPDALVVHHPPVGEGEDAGSIGIVTTDCGAGGGGLLTTIILLVVVGTKLFTVITTAYQRSLAACIPVIESSIQWSVTIPLSLVTGVLRGTAPPARGVVTPRTPLVWPRVKGHPRHDDRWRSFCGQSGGFITAVVFRVEVPAELLTVVTSTHQLSCTALMAIIEPSIQWAITVSLPQPTGTLRSAASPPLEIPS